jgi:hypothetical protein
LLEQNVKTNVAPTASDSFVANNNFGVDANFNGDDENMQTLPVKRKLEKT